MTSHPLFILWRHDLAWRQEHQWLVLAAGLQYVQLRQDHLADGTTITWHHDRRKEGFLKGLQVILDADQFGLHRKRKRAPFLVDRLLPCLIDRSRAALPLRAILIDSGIAKCLTLGQWHRQADVRPSLPERHQRATVFFEIATTGCAKTCQHLSDLLQAAALANCCTFCIAASAAAWLSCPCHDKLPYSPVRCLTSVDMATLEEEIAAGTKSRLELASFHVQTTVQTTARDTPCLMPRTDLING
jgi:hypothetical protein